MRFLGNIALTARGEVVRREPGFWERFKQVFSRDKGLDQRDTQALMTTAHLLAGVRHTLEGVGITNAVRLVIDGVVLFEDLVGKKDDVGDLFAAFYENEALYGKAFKALSLTVEHVEGGLVLVIALTASGDRTSDESHIEVVISGRVEALLQDTPDVASLFASPARPEAYRLQFERFVNRMHDALAAALPEVAVSAANVSTRLVKPSQPATHRAGDPWYAVHPVATGAIDLLVWNAAQSWAWHPDYAVIDDDGTVLGRLLAQAHTSEGAVPDLPDPFPWAEEDPFSAEAGDQDTSGESSGDTSSGDTDTPLD